MDGDAHGHLPGGALAGRPQEPLRPRSPGARGASGGLVVPPPERQGWHDGGEDNRLGKRGYRSHGQVIEYTVSSSQSFIISPLKS